MNNIDIISSLITEDPDIIDESSAKEIILSGLRSGLETIKGGEDNEFAKKLHKKLGTRDLLDLATKATNGEKPSILLIVKEIFMWLGVPSASAAAALLIGLPIIPTLLFKSAVWFAIVDLVDRIKRRRAELPETNIELENSY